MKKNTLKIIFAAFILAFTVVSCSDNYLYEKHQAIANATWEYSDTLDFDFEIVDTNRIYNLYLDVAHSPAYGYQNMYVQIYTKFPSGERIKEQISLEMANKAGVWNGDCNAKVCQLQIPLQEGAFFNEPGSYLVTIEQFMRESPLAGVQKIGFIIEDTKQAKE